MQNQIKLPLTFDPALLKRDLSLIRDCDWIEHFVTQNYQGQWSVVPLRGQSGAEHPVMMIYSDPTCTDFSDTPFLDTCNYLKEVLASFKTDLHSVRLMKLSAGSVIKEHRDHDLSYEDGTIRLHIPITTNADVEFYLDNERVVMEEGECWYLRLSEPHRLVNRGNTDRVHLVIDATVNNWVRDQLTAH